MGWGGGWGGRRRGGGDEDDTEKEKEKGKAGDRKPCNCPQWFGEKYMKNRIGSTENYNTGSCHNRERKI